MLLACTLPLGLAWRLAPLHLPPFAFKYGGSALWAVAIYWVTALLMPGRPPKQLAAIAALIAAGVEGGKLVYWLPLDRFRETFWGKLLLGRYFTFGAIAAYWLAIACVAWLEAIFRPGLVKKVLPAHRTVR